MKKTSKAVILSIVAVVSGMSLNFSEGFWWGPADIKNLIVTILYMTFWGFFLFSAIRSKNQKILIYFLKFWILTFINSMIFIFAQATHFDFDLTIFYYFALILLIPLVALYTPFYGIRYWYEYYEH